MLKPGGDAPPPAATAVAEASHVLTRQLIDFFRLVLEEDGLDASRAHISVPKVVEAINFASRDLLRIENDLEFGPSREKFAAYHAFWIARVKPVSNVLRLDENGHEEVVDINERLAIQLAITLIGHGASDPSHDDVDAYSHEAAREVGYTSPPAPLVWRHCRRRCTGQCFMQGVQIFLSHHDYQHYEYLVHSLRHRAVGPYAIVSFLDALVVSSCYDLSDRSTDDLFPSRH